jgi:hypothetical protein
MRFRVHLVRAAVASMPIIACTDGKSDAPAKTETKSETKSETKAAEEPKPTIVVHTPEDIPVALGGAAMPYTPPPKPAEGKGGAATPTPAPAPAPPSAVAPSAPAAAAPQPIGAIGAVAEAPALAIGHNHAPGEPCTPLARAEVEKALADLRR